MSSISKTGAFAPRTTPLSIQAALLLALAIATTGCPRPDPVCGNGALEDGEACDDGNNIVGDGCTATCTIEPPDACGNSIVEAGEECDDGKLNSDTTVDACRLDCTNAGCGDGVVDTGENCDPPAAGVCNPDCTLGAFCGNGTVDAGESCDDGNMTAGDGCDDLCALELATLMCGSSVMADTSVGTSAVAAWDCLGFPENGPEFVYVFTATANQQVTFNLTNTAPDGDILVLVDTGAGYVPGVCDATLVSVAAGAAPETVVLDAIAGTTYFVVIESYTEMGETGGPVTLDVVCGAASLCGDSLIGVGETCDDGNTTAADGCDAACLLEAGFLCNGEPSVCQVATTGTSMPGLAVPDNDPVGVTDDIVIATSCFITYIQVDIDISTTWVGDLIVDLTSPAGTTVRLHNRTGGAAVDLIGTYPTTLIPFETLDSFLGEDGVGTWTLSVSDNEAADVATVNSWGIAMLCGTMPPCGDGLIGLGEACDDLNTTAGDGCDATCNVEVGFLCGDEPSQCGVITGVSGMPGTPIPDNDLVGIDETLDYLTACFVIGITVDVDITHTYGGDVIIDLTSPLGTVVRLKAMSGDPTPDVIGNYPTTLPPAESLNAFLGEDGLGTWTLTVADGFAMDTGTLNAWGINLACGTVPPCGDGQVNIGEECDDTNVLDADGCSSTCAVEAGFGCSGEPSTCAVTFPLTASSTPALAIPDAPGGPVTDTATIVGASCTVFDINVDVAITHTFRGDLVLILTAPDGTTSVMLKDVSGDGTNDVIGNYPATLTPVGNLSDFTGTSGIGDWTLSVEDVVGADIGTLDSWGVNLTCI